MIQPHQHAGCQSVLPGNKSPAVEVVCCFGIDCQLTGVYTPAGVVDKAKPCVIYLTAGLLHHVGPTRLHVELSRQFAGLGVPGLRFDLSGVGDSETSSMGGYFMERSTREIVQAMDFLQAEYGHKQFVLIGLCSGADDALATAQLDSRVAGIGLLNGYCYQAGWFKLARVWRFYLPRLMMGSKLCNGLQRLLKFRPRQFSNTNTVASGTRFGDTAGTATITESDLLAVQQLDDDYRYIPPREETQNQLLALQQLNTDMLFVYTGSEHEDFTYAGQFWSMFPALVHDGRVTVHFIKEADHTLVLKRDRQRIMDLIACWYESCSFARSPDRSAL